MKRLDRENYNRIIENLNSGAISQENALKQLAKEYQETLCHFPDYEELVLLLNLCIAEDRASQYDDLYAHYRRADEILTRHSGFGLYDAYKLYYCVGVFSFKFHDYLKAKTYLEKCIVDITLQTKDPLDNNSFRNFYIQSKILISYALEYDKVTGGALLAINNILTSGNLNTSEIQVETVYSLSRDDVVKYFFKLNPSEVFNAAGEKMKKEITHMLAHCFSEYAVFLKSQDKTEPCIAYAWELLSEKFIESLGNDMVTCTATVLAEHGHYYRALNLLWERYNTLACSGDDSEKAEISFYIYYFSNRIGLDDDEIQKCKDKFLAYAKNPKNKDAYLYAWITNFRAEFGKAVHNLSQEKIDKLEGLINEKTFDINTHSYVHPQIQVEEKRLQLAYQIIRSYTLINRDAIDQVDNSLFEKCILFNTINCEDTKRKKTSVKTVSWSPDQDSLIGFYGLSLCVRGFSSKFCEKLNNDFHTEICTASQNMMGNQIILIYSNEVQISTLIGDVNERSLTNFVYCESADLKKEFENEVGDDNENYHFLTTLEETFKVAYIQETIERCHICAHRWNEYFIMAPITDNSTFAFQSQVIEKYLDIHIDTENEKKVFSSKNGYVTGDFIEPRSVRKIQLSIPLPESVGDVFWRIFFYHENWLYKYNEKEKMFVPETFCENNEKLKQHFIQLYKRPIRSDDKRAKCRCQLKLNQCACAEHFLSTNKAKAKTVKHLLMDLSVGLLESNENICTLIFPEDLQRGTMSSFMLILSDRSVQNCELRCSFEELVNKCKNSNIDRQTSLISSETGERRIETHDKTDRPSEVIDIKKEVQMLTSEIKRHLAQRSSYMSQEDCVFIQGLLDELKHCESINDYARIKERWKHKMRGN